MLNLKVGKSYNIKVNKPGYTAGEVDVDPHRWTCEPGGRCSLFLAIPPMGRIGVVANWGWLGEDLDLYTWLPNVSSPGGVVGAGASGHPNDLGAGELSDFPRARWNRDGGWGDPLNVETLTIVPRPGSPTIPYYNKTANDYYDFLLTNYGIYGSADLNQELLTLRVWVDGKVVGYVVKTDVCDTDGADNIPGTADDEIWWYAGRMKLGTFIPVDACGTTAIWPYAGVGSIQGVPEGPGGK